MVGLPGAPGPGSGPGSVSGSSLSPLPLGGVARKVHRYAIRRKLLLVKVALVSLMATATAFFGLVTSDLKDWTVHSDRDVGLYIRPEIKGPWKHEPKTNSLDTEGKIYEKIKKKSFNFYQSRIIIHFQSFMTSFM